MDISEYSSRAQDAVRLPLPKRLEVEAVMRFLGLLRPGNKACLDLGFDTPMACQMLRRLGGYWTSVARDAARQRHLAAALGESVECLGPHGELPFEDKQFEVAVLAHGCLSGDAETDASLIREVHRVLKVGGLIVLTVEYAKPFGMAYLLNHRRRVAGVGGCYSESDVFDLLKDGFDVLGMRHFCRFWMQMVRQWVDRREAQGGGAAMSRRLVSALYGAAHLLNLPISLSKGYLMTVHGRRKGWRPRQTPVLADGRRISDAVLKGQRQPTMRAWRGAIGDGA
jgi:SAM-dependent methyltransferase